MMLGVLKRLGSVPGGVGRQGKQRRVLYIVWSPGAGREQFYESAMWEERCILKAKNN